MKRKKIVIATIKSWNIQNAFAFKQKYEKFFDVIIVTAKDQLTYSFLLQVKPFYVFFPHWSWIISASIYEAFTCIVFHMTDLPHGRGGSPLQNLIVNKIYKTKISALKVSGELDAGAIYMKEPFLIDFGNANEILSRCSDIIFSRMIPYIIKNNPMPEKQVGGVMLFNRRKPSESNLAIASLNNLIDVYDFIRMLDGEGYPPAFIQLNNFIITFTQVNKKTGRLTGAFEIKERYNGE